MEPIIRKRTEKDAEELAHAIAVVWNTTYKGIVDNDFLSGLYNCEKESADKIRNSIDKQPNYYILELNHKIIGWIYYTFESDKYKEAAEIHSFYILKEYQGHGYGKLLYNFVLQDLRKNKIKQLVIGCLDHNPSNHFYEHLGGKYIGNGLFREKYVENIYLFTL